MPKIVLGDPNPAACSICDFEATETEGYARGAELLSHYIESHYDARPEILPSTPRHLPATDAWEFAVAQMDHWNRRDSSELPVGGNARISGVPLFDATLRLARFVAGEG